MYSYTPGGLATKKRLTASAAGSVSLETSQTYDNEGKVLTVKYPDVQGVTGRTYTYAYDGIGRPIGLTDDQQTPVSWVNNVQYGPASELRQISYSVGAPMWDGTGGLYSTGSVTETRTYKSPLQLTHPTAGDPSAQDAQSGTKAPRES